MGISPFHDGFRCVDKVETGVRIVEKEFVRIIQNGMFGSKAVYAVGRNRWMLKNGFKWIYLIRLFCLNYLLRLMN